MKSTIARLIRFCFRLRHGITLSNSVFEAMVRRVNDLAETVSTLTDADLCNRFDVVRQKVKTGVDVESVAVEAFALIREAASRTLSMRPYHVQMLAAFAMLQGKCVEMQTGEGKTLAAAVAVCSNNNWGFQNCTVKSKCTCWLDSIWLCRPKSC